MSADRSTSTPRLLEGPPPEGRVVFLFSDVEGSTKLWVEHGERMGESLRLHDEIMRTSIEERGGYVFSTAGDSFGAAFAHRSDAISAALAAQEALDTSDWPGPELRVRIVLHEGTSEVRAGNYFGAAVNLAARVESAGHGGQVLATESVAADHHGAVLSLGEHLLAGFDEPVRLFQLGDGSFPVLRSAEATVSTLPDTRGDLIGRTEDLAKVRRLLAESRIVTLTGVGGAGKTRLAIEAARQRQPRFPGGVFFVDFAGIDDPSAIPGAVTVGLGVAAAGVGQPVETVASRTDGSPALILFDNCEHLIDATAELIDELVARVPELTVLATSREALEIEGERTFRVPSLQGGVDGAAVLLFIERATAAYDTFAPNPADLVDVAAVCEQLDGMPLAIELAASRVRVLPVAEIRRRLDDRFALLSGGRRRSRQRQQTLEATISWSYDLLEPDEQAMLRRLSVFHDGFDIIDVGPVTGFPDKDAVDLVEAISAKSLVEPMQRRGAAGHRLLESIRLFALDRLVATNEIEETRSRHLEHFWTALVRTFKNEGEDMPSPAEIERAGREAQNLSAAFNWALEMNDAAAVVRLSRRSNTWLWTEATLTSLTQLITEKIEFEEFTDDDRLRLLGLIGTGLNQYPWVADQLGDGTSTIRSFMDAEWESILSGKRFLTAASAWALDWNFSNRLPRSADEIVAAYEAHELGAEATGSRWGAALWYLLALLCRVGAERAARRCDELLALRPPEQLVGPMVRSVPLVYTYCLAGRPDDARQFLEGSEDWPSPDVIGGSQTPIACALLHVTEGQPDAAGRHLADALARRAIPLTPGQPSTYLGMYAWIAHALGDNAHAETLIDLVTSRSPWDFAICCHAKARIAGWAESDFHQRAAAWRDDRRDAVVEGGVDRLRHMATVLDEEARKWSRTPPGSNS
jgi:predicted ATPase/class 3 adenylate cyclase